MSRVDLARLVGLPDFNAWDIWRYDVDSDVSDTSCTESPSPYTLLVWFSKGKIKKVVGKVVRYSHPFWRTDIEDYFPTNSYMSIESCCLVGPDGEANSASLSRLQDQSFIEKMEILVPIQEITSIHGPQTAREAATTLEGDSC